MHLETWDGVMYGKISRPIKLVLGVLEVFLIHFGATGMVSPVHVKIAAETQPYMGSGHTRQHIESLEGA